jgi:hypothetical protein
VNGTLTAMDSKPAIEQFINKCFRERTANLKLRLEIHHAYWRRFYHSECDWDSRRGVIEASEAEKIVDISPSDIGFAVVTTGHHPVLHRSRYRVKSSGQSWLIQEVDTECLHCRRSGLSIECTACGGTGWQNRKALVKQNAQRAHRSMSSPDEELEGHPFRDPDIEQFMADHFREQTATRKKELEIATDYAKRFYSPECDWPGRETPTPVDDAERIVSIAPLDAEVLVITHGFAVRLRYHLRPVEQSWLIWEVDPECLLCLQQGRTADCFWCGGTIWDRRKDT